MPTDFSASFHRVKENFKKPGKCSWKGHCKEGSVLREVFGAYAFFAKLNPERFVFASPKAIHKKCSGRYRSGKNKGKRISLSAVNKCTKLMERLGMLSPRLKRSPSGRLVRGRVLAPHDDCCNTYPKRCEFLGPSKKGCWITAPHFVWVGDALADIEFEDGEVPGAFVVPEKENEK